MNDPRPRAPAHPDGLGDAHDDSNEGELVLGSVDDPGYAEYLAELDAWHARRQAEKEQE